MFAQWKAMFQLLSPATLPTGFRKGPVLCDTTPSVTSGCHASLWSFASAL